MKALSIIILIILVFQSTAQNVDIDKLKSAFVELEKNNSQNNQRTFFELFPGSFESFQQAFGFRDHEPAPLYDGRKYVLKFFALDSISKKEQMNKWINISIDGHWEADAVNYFQHNMRPVVLKNVDLFYELLKDRRENEIESFFYFFFNEPHPQFDTIPNDFKMIKNRDEAFYSLIKKGYKRAIEDSGH